MAVARLHPEHFSIPAFLKGLGFVLVFYALCAGWVFMNAAETRNKILSALASQTVWIARDDPAPVAHTASNERNDENDINAPAPEINEAVEVTEALEAPPPFFPEDIPLLESGLIAAPIKDRYEPNPTNLLPEEAIIHDMTLFDAFRRPPPTSYSTSHPAIAIALTGAGLSENLTEKALALLPDEISFVLSPYSSDLDEIRRMIREAGHEVWLHIPTQKAQYPYNDPGPNAILSSVSFSKNNSSLLWAVSQTSGYAGIAVDTDENVFRNYSEPLLELLSGTLQMGMGYLELNADTPHKGLQAMVKDGRYPYAKSFVQWPDSKNNTALTTFLEGSELLISASGQITINIALTPAVLEDLALWTERLENNNIQIVPVSALAAKNQE